MKDRNSSRYQIESDTEDLNYFWPIKQKEKETQEILTTPGVMTDVGNFYLRESELY